MSRLLYADLARLLKSRLFWFCLLFMAGFELFACFNQYYEARRYDTAVVLENVFLIFINIFGFIAAAFCSFFMGAEHSDGTLRNKIIVGHKRSHIYLSGFLTCTIAGLLFAFAAVLAACAAGIPLFGFFEKLSVLALLLIFLDSALLIGAYMAVFNLIAWLNSNRTVASIASLIGVFALFMAAVFLLNALEAPKFVEQITVIDGQMKSSIVANPRYLSGSARTFYQFLVDLLPTGQSITLSALQIVHPKLMALYSAIIIAAANLAGIFFFRRKNLK